MRQNNAFVIDFVFQFANERNLCPLQFDRECILINNFIVAFAKLAMNFHAETDELEYFIFLKQFAHCL